jgi:hypothetical protein
MRSLKTVSKGSQLHILGRLGEPDVSVIFDLINI